MKLKKGLLPEGEHIKNENTRFLKKLSNTGGAAVLKLKHLVNTKKGK